MGTRSIISFGTPDEWRGVYVHWDGYPTGVGAQLVEDLEGKSDDEIRRYINDVIRSHPTGYSSIIPGEDYQTKEPYGRVCFCHDRGEGYIKRDGEHELPYYNDADWFKTTDCEWLYVIDREAGLLHVAKVHWGAWIEPETYDGTLSPKQAREETERNPNTLEWLGTVPAGAGLTPETQETLADFENRGYGKDEDEE